MILVVIHAYGSFDASVRSPKEMEGLNEYLASVIGKIRSLDAPVESVHVLVAGGAKDKNGMLECDSLAEELLRRDPDLIITKDCTTLSTEANVVSGFSHGIAGKYTHIVQCCDLPRRRKTVWLCHRFAGKASWQVAAFARKDITYRSTVWFQEVQLSIMKLRLNPLVRWVIERTRH